MMNGFWNITFGNILTLAAVLLAFWSAHQASVKAIEDAASRMTAVEVKLDLIYGWFESNVLGKLERKHTD